MLTILHPFDPSFFVVPFSAFFKEKEAVLGMRQSSTTMILEAIVATFYRTTILIVSEPPPVAS